MIGAESGKAKMFRNILFGTASEDLGEPTLEARSKGPELSLVGAGLI